MIASCSFCLRPNTEVRRLVAGPGVYICDGCVEVCAELVRSERPAGEPQAPWDREMSRDELLDLLPRVAAAGALAERALAQWVRKAHGQGATWARIGSALGMTRQAAWERFAGER